MPPREDDAVAPRPGTFDVRRLLIPGGFALAVLATLAVFTTDNEQYLRIAVVAVAWAFVLATFAAGRRDADRVAAAARETELRQAYELELDREVAARRDYEAELEHELRREAEESMRYELDALRGELASLSELRGDITSLSELRDDVARVAALRDDVASLLALRHDLGQLAELRAEMGRLRAELTEQLSSEMLVERITMRTQASRLSGEPGRLDGGPTRGLETGSWADDVPPRELTGGWPAVRLDEPRDAQQFDEVRIERSGLRPPVPSAWEPAGAGQWSAAPPQTTMSPIAPSSIARPPAPVPAPPVPAPPVAAPPVAPPVTPPPVWQPPATEFSPLMWQAPAPAAPAPVWQPPATEFQDVRRPIGRPPVPPPVAEPQPSPLDWLAARSLLDPPPPPGAPAPTSSQPEVPEFRRRAGDEPRAGAGTQPPAEPRTTHRPAVPPPVRVDDRGGYRVAVRDEAPATAPGPAQEKRLADILAENGVSPTSGGRRRRRYRDEDEPDDVLARVLGQS